MIQISDLVLICVRRFLEVEHGYREGWSPEIAQFYAERYAEIHGRIARKQLVERAGRNITPLNEYLSTVRCEPVGRWKQRYGLN